MKNKKLIIGGAVAVVLGYFLLKKKPVSNPFPEGKLEEESRPLLPSFDEGLHVGIWDPDKWNFDAMENVLGRRRRNLSKTSGRKLPYKYKSSGD